MVIEKTAYGMWGECVRMANNEIELFATLDIGPRVIRFGYIGGGNIMCEDVEGKSLADGAEFDRRFGAGSAWYIHGGHRLWTSPEAMPRSYYPDNEKVDCKINGNTVTLTPPPQKWTQLQLSIEITMSENSNDVTVKHYITNIGAWEVELAAWALSVLAPGGMEIVPQPTRDTGLLGNRVIALWPYTNMADKRVYWGDKFITLRQDEGAAQPFKFGINSEHTCGGHARAAYILDGTMFIKRFNVNENGNYPDGGMSFETYTNFLMLEMESLSELKKLRTDETVEHTEYWSLRRGVSEPRNEAEMAELFV